MRKSRDFRKKNEKKVHISSVEQEKAQKKPPYKPSGLYRGENKKKNIYK